ncbi:hypothetical protein D3C81_2170380 [compost metagenome]
MTLTQFAQPFEHQLRVSTSGAETMAIFHGVADDLARQLRDVFEQNLGLYAGGVRVAF